MGLFGITSKEDTEIKQANQAALAKYNRKMDHYTKSLEHFDDVVKKLEGMINDYESKDHTQQVSNVNFVLDLKYLKEQGDQVSERLMDVSEVQLREIKKQIDTGYCLIEEMNHSLEQESDSKLDVERKLHSNNRLLKVVICGQFAVLVGMIVILLNLLGVIVL